MTLYQAVQEIIQRTDESFAGVSEERARRMFFVALIALLRQGEFSDVDIAGFIRTEHAVPIEETSNFVYIPIGALSVLAILQIWVNEPEGGDTTIVTKATTNDLRMLGMSEFKPVYDIKYTVDNNKIKLFPRQNVDGKTVMVKYIIQPNENCEDSLELNSVLSKFAQNTVIEQASALLSGEVARNEG